MIQKKYPHSNLFNNTVELTDAQQGAGRLQVEGVGQSRYVYDTPAPTTNQWGYSGYRSGHYEHDLYRVTGCTVPEGHPVTFGLKLYEGGFILPSSLVGATTFATKAEAAAMGEKWLAEGGPGLSLESLAETQVRHRIERSAGVYAKVARQITSLVDADLLKLVDAANKLIAKREENVLKDAAKAVFKAQKAAEKVRAAEEKAKKVADKAVAKALKDAKASLKQTKSVVVEASAK